MRAIIRYSKSAMLCFLLTMANLTLALSLSDRSPFIPEGFDPNTKSASTAATTTNQPLEFRGMYQLGSTYYFLVSQRNSSGKWLPVGEASDGITIKEFQADENKVLVDHNGNPIWLDMSEMAKLTGGPVSQPARQVTRNITPTSSSSSIRAQRSSTTRRTIRPSTLTRSQNVRTATSSKRRYSKRAAGRNPNLDPSTAQPPAPTPPPSVPSIDAPGYSPGSPPPSSPDFKRSP
jgi:hypothetical protein